MGGQGNPNIGQTLKFAQHIKNTNSGQFVPKWLVWPKFVWPNLVLGQKLVWPQLATCRSRQQHQSSLAVAKLSAHTLSLSKEGPPGFFGHDRLILLLLQETDWVDANSAGPPLWLPFPTAHWQPQPVDIRPPIVRAGTMEWRDHGSQVELSSVTHALSDWSSSLPLDKAANLPLRTNGLQSLSSVDSTVPIPTRCPCGLHHDTMPPVNTAQLFGAKPHSLFPFKGLGEHL